MSATGSSDTGGRAESRARLTSYEHDGLTFDVLDDGPLDGEAVVLLHGFPERASTWREVSPRLHGAGLRTFAPDQRGYSPGARPPRRRDYRLDHLVDDVAALIGEIGTPVHLVGHDWGAAVAWSLTGRHPELVRTLTAVSVPPLEAFTRALRTSRQALKSWYMLSFQVPRLPELMASRPGGGFDATLRQAGMTREEVARFHTEIVEYGALPGALGWYRALPWTTRLSKVPTVTVPSTMVWSDGDTAVGRRAVEGAERYVAGDYELVVLHGVTHWIPTQAADALAEVVLTRVLGA